MIAHTSQRWVPGTLMILGFLSTCLVVRTASAASSHWPQWRGPNGNGLASGNPPLEWSEEKNVKWKLDLPGQGHGTPVIWGDQLFVMAAVPTGKNVGPAPQAGRRPLQVFAQQDPGQRRERPQRGGGQGGRGPGGRGGRAPTEEMAYTLFCIDRNDGRQIWSKVARTAVPHEGVQSANTYCSESAVTDGERVYASFNSQGIYCYDMQGELLWQKDIGQVPVTFGEASSPTLVGDALIVLQDNNRESYLYAFDKKTGKELWKKSRDEGSGWTTPYVLTHDGQIQVVISGSNAIRSYDPKTGELIWQCSGLGSNPVPMIVSDDTTVYAMSGHRQPMALAIALGRKGDLTGTDAVRWKTERGTPYVPSPLLYDGLLFFCQRTSGSISCLDATSGEPHFEQARLDALSGVYASPVGLNDRIYLAGQNGATVVLAKSKELKVLATNKLNDGFDASPVVVGDHLYLRGRENLYCIAAQ